MAKLSELKKVNLLEQKVLSGNIEEVKKVLNEESPIEFTAKALGLACRFSGSEMVETLIDGGASFYFTLTPTLKRKYNCYYSVNNNYDLPIDFAKYLFPKYVVNGYPNSIIDNSERVKVLDVLYHKDMGDFSDILYFAIYYNDIDIFNELLRLGVNKLSQYRTDIVSGRLPMNRLDSSGRYDRRKFQLAIQDNDDMTLKNMLNNFLSCMEVDTITLFASDFYTEEWSDYSRKNIFISR